MDNTLWKSLPGIQTIVKSQSFTAPQVMMVPGDVIRDNEINLLDYNMMISCLQSTNCSIGLPSSMFDFNDDGIIDEVDLNILLSSFSKRLGD